MDDSPITRGSSRLESGEEVKENYLSLLLAVGCGQVPGFARGHSAVI